LLIGANCHESHHLFDLFYNSTSLIKPDVLSTDTEGANQLNFLLLHTIDKLFAPRYRSLSAKTNSIISSGDLSQFNDLLIKPNRVFNEKLARDEEDNMQHIIASLLSGDTNQSTIVRKLSASGFKSRTKDALWEMNSALMTEHLLTYIGDVDFRQAIQGGLCRGEAYHQLRRTIEKVNGRHFRGTSDIQMATWNECARLLANCVIYYNAVILNELKEESDSRGDVERSQKLIRFSPAAWAHINFQGRYIFMDNSFSYDIKNEIKKLFDVLVQ
jgi:TnpA family transposase